MGTGLGLLYSFRRFNCFSSFLTSSGNSRLTSYGSYYLTRAGREPSVSAPSFFIAGSVTSLFTSGNSLPLDGLVETFAADVFRCYSNFMRDFSFRRSFYISEPPPSNSYRRIGLSWRSLSPRSADENFLTKFG